MTARRLLAFVTAFALSMAVPLMTAAATVRSTGAGASPRSWSAQAAADGTRIEVVVNDFLVVSNIVDAGGPATQAVVNAFGDSRAYAAYPYPGEIALTAHGLSQGAAPPYPLIAQSDPTQPKTDVAAGPYELHARSTDDTSSALAKASGGGGDVAIGTTQSSASAVHDTKTGAVSAVADTTAEGISVAGVLSIGRVHSHAQMAATLGAPATRSSDTEAADVNVGGQQVGLTDKGLVLAGTDIPLPPDSTANALLSSAGIAVHYLAPSTTPTSTVAPGFAVSTQQNVPGVGDTTVTYVFGQAVASAQVTGAVAPTEQAGSSVVPPTGGTAPPSTSGPASAPVTSTSTPSTGLLNQPPSQASPPETAPAPSATNGYTLVTSSRPSSESFYLVIAAGAIVMVAAAQLFRILAVKLAWT